MYRLDHTQKIKDLLTRCFKEYCVISDTTPTYTEHFCVVLRAVTLDWQIVEVVIRCWAFDGSFNAETMAGTLLQCLEEQYSLDLNNWRCYVADRCAVNGAMVDKIVISCKLNVTKIPCVSHGICNSGSHFDVPNAKRTAQGLTKMVKYIVSKATENFTKVFHQKPLKATGPRWWMDYEQYAQIDSLGFENVVEKHVNVCHQLKYSERSSKALFEYLQDKQVYAKSLVEIAAVVDGGNALWS